MGFHKKLGFKYHQSTTRILVLIPDLFLVIYTVLSSPSYRCSYQSPSHHRSYESPSYRYRCSYETQGLEIALVFVGFAWSFICAVSSLISFYCVCTPRSRAKKNSDIEVGDDVDVSTKVVEASVRSNDEINILTC